MLKNSTQIVKSPKVIEVPDEEGIPAVITLSQIQHIQKFLKVSTEVKVLVQKREPIYVSTGKMKQDVIVADHTSTMKVNLWEDYVDFMEDKSYSLTDFVVREYNCRQYLSMPKEGATIAPIEDIGGVEQPDDDSNWSLSAVKYQMPR